MTDTEFTVGDLRRHLQAWPEDTKLTFAGGLTFYRVKRWSDDEVFIEFGEPQGYLDEEFKKRNPHVKVVFIDTETAEWDEGGVIGSIDVEVR